VSPLARRIALLPVLALLGAACASTQTQNEPWIEVRSANFRFVSQIDELRTTELANELELFQGVLKKLTNAREFEPRVQTTIFVLRDTYAYRLFAPRGSAGVFIPLQRANFAVVDAESKRISASNVLLHEYTHYVVHNDATFTYPRWYDEGFAELMSGTDVEKEHIDLGLPLAHRQMSVQDNRFLPLRKMVTDDRRVTEVENRILYAKAWRFLHYLRYGSRVGFPDRSAQVSRYLLRFNEGATPEAAFREAFGTSFEALDQEFEEYLRKGQLRGLRISREGFPDPAPPTARRMSAAEVATELGTLALAREDTERAESLFRAALQIQPDDARAVLGLASTLRQRTGPLALLDRSGEVDALYARGLELAPDAALSQLDYAAYLLARAEDMRAGEEQSKLLSEARVHLLRAIELDAKLPEAHAKRAQSYLEFEGQDSAAGLAAAARAHQLLSSNAEINYLLALGLFRADRLAEAKQLASAARLRAFRKVEGLDALDDQIDAALAAAPPADAPPVSAR